MSTRGAIKRRIFVGVEADEPKRVLEVSETPVGRLIRAEALSAPFGDRVQRRILQQLRGRQFDKGVRHLPKRRAKLLDEARLADAGLADDERELALAIADPLPAPPKLAELFLAPDQGRQLPGADAPPAARALDAKEGRRLGRAFQRMRAAILGDEQAGQLTVNTGGDQHRSRIGKCLYASGDVGRVAEHLAHRLDDDLSRV